MLPDMDARTAEENPHQDQKEDNGMSQNSEADVDYFSPCSWYYSLVIATTSKSSDKLSIKEFATGIVRFFSCTCIVFIGMIFHLWKFHSDSTVIVVEDMMVAMYYMSSFIVVILYLRRPGALASDIYNLYEFFPKPHDLDDMMIMHKKYGEFILRGSYIFMMISVIIANIDVSECTEKMHTPLGYRKCGFITPMWLPIIEFDQEVIRLCLVVLFYVHTTIIALFFAVVAISYAITIHHLVRGCDALILLVEDICTGGKETSERDRLVAFITHHNKFLESLASYMETIEPYLLVAVGSAVIFVGVSILDIIWVGPSLIAITLVLGWGFSITFTMVISQKLTDKSLELSQAVYSLPWYDMDKESKFLILFILMRTQKPMIMKTPFSAISHSTLLSEEDDGVSQNAEADVDYFIPCSWYYRLFIVTTSKYTNKLSPREFAIAIVRFLSCTSFLFIGTIFHLWKFHSDSTEVVMEDLTVGLYYISFIAVVILYLRRPGALTIDIYNLYEFFPKPKDLGDMLRKQKKYAVFILSSLYMFAMIGLIIANIDVSECTENMHTPLGYRKCGFLTPVWLPRIEFDHEVFRLCLVVLVNAHTLIMASFSATVMISYGITMHHLIRGCDTLILLVEDVCNEDKETSERDRLVAFITHHNQYLESLDSYIGTIRPYLFIGVSTGVIFMAVSILDIIWLGPSMPVIAFMMSWGISVTFIMVIAQQLTNKSFELSQAVYSLPWYDMDKESKFLILFILMRTQKPMVFKTPFSVMSHPTLLSVMKATYSYTAAMIQNNNK